MTFSKYFQKTHNNKKGVTLIELVFSSVLGVMVLGVIIIHYVVGINGISLGTALAEVNSDARLAMDHIVRDARSARELDQTHLTYTTRDDEIIIKMYSINSTGDVFDSDNDGVPDETYDRIIYALDASEPTRLRKIIDPHPSSSRKSLNQVVAENINSFELFSDDGTLGGTPLSLVSATTVTALKIALTVDKAPLQNKPIVRSEVKLRNND